MTELRIAELLARREVRQGSRYDALRYAATVGAAQGGVAVDDAMTHIRCRSGGHWRKER